MDKLLGIKVFLAVARLGSYSTAARELGLSKAMASKHVARLESDLGVRLFNRTTRKVSLTENGAVYRDRMGEIIADIDETETLITSLNAEPVGNLRIMAPASYGAFHLTRAATEYRRLHDGVSVELVLSDRKPDLVEDGIDLAITFGELEDASYVARQIGTSRIVVCGAPKYLASHNPPGVPADLVEHNCLIYTARQRTGEWHFTVDGATTHMRVDGDFRSTAGEALRVATLQGAGLAQLPTYMVGLDIKAGRLRVLLESFEPPPRPMHVIYLHRRYLSAKVRTFVEFLRRRYDPEPYWERWAEQDVAGNTSPGVPGKVSGVYPGA